MVGYKLSIIVPTFNLEDKLFKTFRSIQNQTIGFENIEVIFVDDQSSDRTVNILNNYASHFKNVSLYSTEANSGFAGKPRNIGLEKATADFVMFLDGDDELLRDSCEVLYNKIYYDACDVVVGGQINVFDGIHQHNPPSFYSEERIFENPIDMELLNISPAITAKIFKKQFLEENEIRFPEGIPGQDLVFLIEALLHSKKTFTLNDFYVYFRNVHDSSTTFNINEKYLYGLIDAYLLVCNLLNEFNVPCEIQEVVLSRHLNFLTTQISRADSLNKMDCEKISEIMNSDSFEELSQKYVFTNNQIFRQYFDNMSKGIYDNHELLNEILENKHLSYYDEVIENYDNLTSEVKELNDLNSSLSDESVNLKNRIVDLKVINSQLKDNIILSKEEVMGVREEFEELEKQQIHLEDKIKYLTIINKDLIKELNELKQMEKQTKNSE